MSNEKHHFPFIVENGLEVKEDRENETQLQILQLPKVPLALRI